MKIIILGCGYLGFNINKYLKEKYECEIWGLKSYYSEKCDNFKEINVFDNIEISKQDLKDCILIDCISLVSNTENNESILENVILKYSNLFETLKTKNLKRYIMLSSGGTIYGNSYEAIKEDHILNPLTVYAKSKYLLENLLKKSNIDYLILRPTNPYGGEFEPNKLQGVINILILKAFNQEPFVLFNDAKTIRDYIYIDDFVNAIYLLIKEDINNEIINISSKQGTSLQNVIDIVEHTTNRKIIIEKKDSNIPTINSIILSNEKLIKLTNYKQKIELKQGIKLEVERVKKELNI